MHSFLQKSVIFHVEQVAFAVAVRTAETAYRFAFFANDFGGLAFFWFVCFFEENFEDFCCGVVEQVINVPKLSLLFSEVPFYSPF